MDLEMNMQPDVGTSSSASGLTRLVVGPSGSPSKSFLFKVHKKLREVNEEAYEPYIVSIDPYHRGKPNLQMMEVQKQVYLQLFLAQRGEEDTQRYISALRPLEERAQKCYAEYTSLDSNEFVEMMLLDGLFIIEVILRFGGESMMDTAEHRYSKDDHIFKTQWMVNSLQRDLMLFENQLPFFILIKILEMVNLPLITPLPTFFTKALTFFNALLPNIHYGFLYDGNKHSEISHLLELVHECSLRSLVVQRWHGSGVDQERKSRGFIPNATELQEAGVELKADEPSFREFNIVRGLERIPILNIEGNWIYARILGVVEQIPILDIKGNWIYVKILGVAERIHISHAKTNWIDIKFEGGVMKIPSLTIEDRTETFFRNLIAYEQYRPSNEPSPLTDYARFLDCLIDTPKDVQILSHLRIIDNLLGDDEVVSTMFNKISEAVVAPKNNFKYADIFTRVEYHCSRSRNRWMAILKRDYFNSPWALISIFAALLLLGLTLTQTYFAIFPRK